MTEDGGLGTHLRLYQLGQTVVNAYPALGVALEGCLDPPRPRALPLGYSLWVLVLLPAHLRMLIGVFFLRARPCTNILFIFLGEGGGQFAWTSLNISGSGFLGSENGDKINF